MHARYSAADRIMRAVAFGSLEAARSDAALLASEMDEADAKPEWKARYAKVREAARGFDAATDVPGAATATAALGRACAECHEAAGARLYFAEEPMPAGGSELSQQMRHHQTASTRLWQGLIASDNRYWDQGATQLASSPLDLPEADAVLVNDTSDFEHSIAKDVAQLRFYANRAVGAMSQDDRRREFGEILATCASCHANRAAGASTASP